MRSRLVVLGWAAVLLCLAGCETAPGPTTGALRITAATTGGDPDLNGYIVQLDGANQGSVPANGVLVIRDLATGSHGIALTDMAPNCVLVGVVSLTVGIRAGDTTRVTLNVACVATGVRVTTTTTGLDRDADGYAVLIDGVQAATIGINTTIDVTRLAAGGHEVALAGLAANCVLTNPAPQPVALILGQVVNVAFATSCTATSAVIEISTATTGIDLDGNGYSFRVDTAAAQTIATNATARVTAGIGDHTVTLAGLNVNCTVAGENPRTVSVGAGGLTRDTIHTTFNVTCVATTGVIETRTVTSGLDPDPDGYFISVDDAAAQAIGASAFVRATVPPGLHQVQLDGVSGNCTVGGDNPRSVTVTAGTVTRDTVRTTFDLTCGAASGVIEVTAVTGGVEPDTDGYQVHIDDGSPQTLAANGTVWFGGVGAGDHEVRLTGNAANCLAGAETRSVSVVTNGPARDTARTTFDITCVARSGMVRIITATTGTDVDANGYQMTVDCNYYYYGPSCYTQYYTEQMSPNDTVLLAQVPIGFHTFQLDDVAGNCAVAGGPSMGLSIPGGVVTDVVFSVSCVAYSRLDVTTVTTGADIDADGYIALLEGPQGVNRQLAPNGTAAIAPLLPGAYTVKLLGLSLNCAAASADNVPVTIPDGATATVTFTVDCQPARQLAFDNGDIYQIKTSGGGREQLTTHAAPDVAPAWSRDGSKIVFSSGRDGNAEIYVLDVATPGVQTRLTNSAQADEDPVWSPAADRIAFVSWRTGNPEIFVMNADGSNPVNLTQHVAFDYDPAWSPDGTKIAFASERGGIYIMDADGTDTTRMTDNPGDRAPTWSPDGTKLAFSRVISCSGYYGACEHDLFVVNVDGTGLARLYGTYNDERDPVWSPDGAWIAFTASPCDYYYGCYYDTSLMAVRSNGTDARLVVASPANHPAWKP